MTRGGPGRESTSAEKGIHCEGSAVLTAHTATGGLAGTEEQIAERGRRGLRRRPTRRTVPAAVLHGSELIHLGGGENIACPGAGSLPIASYARRLGLGSPALALPPAKVHVLRDSLICPSSRVVVDGRGRIVAESLTQDMYGRVSPSPDELRGRPLEIEGTVAVYRSPWRPHYHTLVDHLPRAALLGQPAMRRVGPITLVHDGSLSDLEKRLLESLVSPRVRIRAVPPGRAVAADRILLPGYVTRPAAGAIPSWYRRWLDRFAAGVDVSSCSLTRRFFIDRPAGARSVLNRAALESVLADHGVRTVDPSSLGADEQVALFRNAELIVGVTGSGLANALFSRSASIIELVPGRELLPHYFYLAVSKGLPYTPVLAPADRHRLSAVDRLTRPVEVDVEGLDRVLRERLDRSNTPEESAASVV